MSEPVSNPYKLPGKGSAGSCERAVPAEVADLEAALRSALHRWARAIDTDSLNEFPLWLEVLRLENCLSSKRSKSATGGNAKGEQRP